MLCLFWMCCAFFCFLILGIGKPFKIKELQVFQGWSGLNSQNLKPGGGQQVFKRCKRTRAKKFALTKNKYPKSRNQKRNLVITIIYYIYIQIYTHQLTCADFYARLLQLLYSCAILYTCFFLAFLVVKYSKSQHIAKKRHSKKPLQFCNMKKLVKTSTYKNYGVPFFENPFWALHSSNTVTI